MTSSREINENKIKKIIKKFFSLIGYKITKINSFNDRYFDFIAESSEEENKDLKNAAKLALTSKSNLWSIVQSLKYISNKKIEGDIVECGVFKGGSLALITKYSKKLSIKSKIIGFDTFEDGFDNVQLTEYDIDIKGQKVKFSNDGLSKEFYPTTDIVRKNIEDFLKTKIEDVVLIKGDVHKTLKNTKNIPEKISFLRLDTDLYSTTKLQLEILFPKLVSGGILHIDDYGFLPGVRKAVDNYFKNSNIWLHRVDLTARLLIKE